MPLVIAAENLTKRYGQRSVVDCVSFEIAEGEVLGLLGPNGSGKSTILRMLAGYLQPSAGRARVAGFDVCRQGREARRHLGYVPEDVLLYSHMRVEEFLRFMGRLKGLRGAGLRTAVDSVCAQFSLDAVRQTAIGRLSRGFRQRVAIAQAMVNRPALLILDEPTNGLDPRQIIEMRELIGGLAARCTVLVTSHILGEIARIATRVAILLDGRMLAERSLTARAQPCLRVRLRGHAAVDPGVLLSGVAGVTGVEVRARDDGIFACVVEVDDAPAVAERLAVAVGAAGLGLIELTETGGDLEALFLDLTARAVAP